VLAAQFQQVQRACGVRGDIDPRVLHALAHARPRRQVHHRIVGHVRLKNLARRFPLADVYLLEAEIRFALQLAQSPPLEGRVVSVVEVVYANHLVSLLHQQFGGLCADESRTARQ
jgi:hypothetical protein